MIFKMGSFFLDVVGRKAIILFACVIKTRFLRMLKSLVPIRDIFLFHEIYILFDFNFIQWITIKVTEIIIVSHFHETKTQEEPSPCLSKEIEGQSIFLFKEKNCLVYCGIKGHWKFMFIFSSLGPRREERGGGGGTWGSETLTLFRTKKSPKISTLFKATLFSKTSKHLRFKLYLTTTISNDTPV